MMTGEKSPTLSKTDLLHGRFDVLHCRASMPGQDTWLCRDLQRGGVRVLVRTLRNRDFPSHLLTVVCHAMESLRQQPREGLADVFDVIDEGGFTTIVTRWVEGSTLQDRLAHGPLPLEQALHLAVSIFRSLDQLHQQGVLHRRLDADHILVEYPESRSAILAGPFYFGRYHAVGDANISPREAAYMAPEEAGTMDASVAAPTDLYSAGIVFFQMLTGQLPFAGPDVSDYLLQHVSQPVPDIRSFDGQFPIALNAVIQRLLTKDPRARYQTARAVVHDLYQIQEGLKRQTNFTLSVGMVDERDTLTQPAFIGRTSELARVESLLEATLQGMGGTGGIYGERGIGKSALLEQIVGQATAKGICTLTTPKWDRRGAWYFPFASVARKIVEQWNAQGHSPSEFELQLRPVAPTLLSLFPQLTCIWDGQLLPKEAPEEFGENRAIDALARLLEHAPLVLGPAILTIDDAHRIEGPAWKVLTRWRQQTRNDARRLSVLFTMPEEADLPELTAAEATPEDLQVRLEPLSDAEIVSLAQSMAGPLPAEALERVCLLADGKPAIAITVLRTMEEAGILVSKRGGWELQADGLQKLATAGEMAGLVERRVHMLDERTRRLLTVGACLGPTFSAGELSALSGLSLKELLAALRPAVERHLLMFDADSQRFSFQQDIVRQLLLQQADEEVVRETHRQAAGYFIEHAPDQLAAIAEHLDLAMDFDRAAPYAILAGRNARREFQLQLAEKMFQIAHRASAGLSPEDRLEICCQLGDVRMLQGKYAAAEPAFQEALRMAPEGVLQARVQAKLAELSFKRGSMQVAATGIETALQALGLQVPRTIIGLHFRLAWQILVQVLHTLLPQQFVGRRRRPPDQREQLRMQLLSKLAQCYWFCRSKAHCLWAHLRGMNYAECFTPSSELAHIYSDHAPAMCLIPMFRRAKRYAERSLELYRQLKDPWGQGQALTFYSCVLYYASEFEECIRRGREAIELLQTTGDYWRLHIARYQVAAALYHTGDFRGAVEECRLNHQSGVLAGDEQASGIIFDVWARAAREKLPGDLLAAEMERPRHDVQGQCQMQLAAGIAAIYRHQWMQAVRHLESAKSIARKAGIHNAYTIPVYSWLATAYRHVAMEYLPYQTAVARQWIRRAKKSARQAMRHARLTRNDLPRALREYALCAAIEGDWQGSQTYLDRSIKEARRQHARLELAKSLRYRSQLHASADSVASLQDAEEAQNIMAELLVGDASVTTLNTTGTQNLSLIDRFENVLDSGRKIVAALSSEAIFEAAKDAAQKLLRGDHCELVLLPKERPAHGAAVHSPHPLINYLCERALATGRATVVSRTDGVLAGGTEVPMSLLAVPIRERETMVAVLCVTHHSIRGLFGTEEEKLADFIACLAGAALENAAGFEELAQLNATLEQRVAKGVAEAQAQAEELSRSNLELERIAHELLQAQKELRRARDAAEAASQAKSRFLATMSHEIRTPMNGILGMTQLALHGQLNPHTRRCLETIQQSGEALLTLLNDVLDLSKIEAGRMVLEQIEYDVHATIGDATKLMAVTAANKGIELLCHIAPDVPRFIVGDPARLRQTIINLVGNAIKFTDHGEVALAARLVASDQGHCLRISVTDTGPGIPADKQEAIFEAFEQSDSSTTRRYGGTGLGLAICAQIAQLMGGRIWVESELGFGSTFHLEFPLKAAHPGAAEESTGREVAWLRHVKLFTRNGTAATFFEETLSAVGIKVHVTDELASIWSQHDSSQQSPSAGLVIVDVPAGESGREVIETAASLTQEIVDSLLVAVPANLVNLLEESWALPANRVLVKPITRQSLFDAIAALAPEQGLPTPPPESIAPESEDRPLPPASAHATTILIADDAPVNREVAVGILELFGYQCLEATNGQEAVQQCLDQRPPVILMDVDMPEMDGLQATRRIRELCTADYRPIIIAMTAHGLAEVQRSCLEAGMDDCLEKPFQPDHLVALLERLLASSQDQHPPGSGEVSTAAGPSEVHEIVQ